MRQVEFKYKGAYYEKLQETEDLIRKIQAEVVSVLEQYPNKLVHFGNTYYGVTEYEGEEVIGYALESDWNSTYQLSPLYDKDYTENFGHHDFKDVATICDHLMAYLKDKCAEGIKFPEDDSKPRIEKLYDSAMPTSFSVPEGKRIFIATNEANQHTEMFVINDDNLSYAEAFQLAFGWMKRLIAIQQADNLFFYE